MQLLLDTHVVIWWLTRDSHVGIAAQNAIKDPGNAVFVSAVTGFEIATKKNIGKLEAPDDLPDQLQAKGFQELPVTLVHGLEAGQLPLHHRDLFDRLLVAQARCEKLTLVTSDHFLTEYDVQILPAS